MSMPETTRPSAPRKPSLHALVTVRWGDTVLATRPIEEGSDATVGAAASTLIPLPCEELGVPSVTVATVRGGAPIAFIPRGAVGFRERPRMLPSPVAGPSEITLTAGETVSFPIGRFIVLVSAEETERAPWSAALPAVSSLSSLRYVAVAALAHALVMGLSAQAAFASSMESVEPDHEELRRFIAAAEDRSRAEEKVITDFGENLMGKDVNARDGNGKDGGGTRARGVEGSMGSTESRQKSKSRFAVTGRDSNDATTWASREEAIRDARSFGMTALLHAEKSHAPVSAFGNAAAGADPFAASGAMWGEQIGETWGAGGLGLSGTGSGGGGTGEGSIGLGTIGTIGHTVGRPGLGTGGGGSSAGGLGLVGWGGSWGGPWGEGIGLGRIGTIGHGAGVGVYDLNLRRAERKKASEDEGDARLPRETVQRVVRQASGVFRSCYQSALLANPALAGGITTRFLIGADGRVKSASNLGADLPDSKVIACVTRAFQGLVFPEPPGGVPVTVTYPLTFSPAH
jgi:hypothetical protein